MPSDLRISHISFLWQRPAKPTTTPSSSTPAGLCTVHTGGVFGGMRGAGQPVMGPWHSQVGVFLSGTAVKMLSYHSVQAHNVSQQTQLTHVLFVCHLWSDVSSHSLFTLLEMDLTRQSRWVLSALNPWQAVWMLSTRHTQPAIHHHLGKYCILWQEQTHNVFCLPVKKNKKKQPLVNLELFWYLCLYIWFKMIQKQMKTKVILWMAPLFAAHPFSYINILD